MASSKIVCFFSGFYTLTRNNGEARIEESLWTLPFIHKIKYKRMRENEILNYFTEEVKSASAFYIVIWLSMSAQVMEWTRSCLFSVTRVSPRHECMLWLRVSGMQCCRKWAHIIVCPEFYGFNVTDALGGAKQVPFVHVAPNTCTCWVEL